MTKCPYCWQPRPPESFVTERGRPTVSCAVCREKYRGWSKLTPEEKAARRTPRLGLHTTGPIRVRFVRDSKNRKLGLMASSLTTANTCPPSCSFFGNGCYHEFGLMLFHWKDTQSTGLPWSLFCKRVRGLPASAIWRHNTAGDLPGDGQVIAPDLLSDLLDANIGKRGFTFTHYPTVRSQLHPSSDTDNATFDWNRQAIAAANRAGFTVNLSADSLEQADELADLGIGPVATVLPHDAPSTGTVTPAGRKVIVCPAETSHLTCLECQLCAKPHKAIVGFRAHGQFKAEVSRLVQLRRGREEAVA